MFLMPLSFSFKQELINSLLAQPYGNLQLPFISYDASTSSSHNSVQISLASFSLSWMLSLGLSRLASFKHMQGVKMKTSSTEDEGEVMFGVACFILSISTGFSILKCTVAVTMPHHMYLFIHAQPFFLSAS